MAKGRKRKRTNSEARFSIERMTNKINAAPPMNQRCSTANSDESSASCLSSNDESFHHVNRNRIINFSDPEVESVQAETSTCDCGSQIIRRRKMSLLSEVRPNSPEVDSEENKLEKMPTESELDEFFAAAEKDIQKHFEDKYNYDIVNDTPFEGRYEWVELKP